MSRRWHADEIFGIVRPASDAHTLGASYVSQLLTECGVRVCPASREVAEALQYLGDEGGRKIVLDWLRRERVTRVGFSYRLDPQVGAELFGAFMDVLADAGMFYTQGGPLAGVYFAGLPDTCARVRNAHGDRVVVISGELTPAETLELVGLPASMVPDSLAEASRYDAYRMDFGRELVSRGSYLSYRAPDHSGYPLFGRRGDLLIDRIDVAMRSGTLPLTRAHVGPYGPDREGAVRQFEEWLAALAASGHLDVVSVGTSQLTQSHFFESWHGLPNGGGVPLKSIEEYVRVWEAARPMLVRTYAGTRRIVELAAIYESAIDIAWHALSFWWFCQIDGRGPNTVHENLREHFETLNHIALTGKPFEANVPHHFAFRGADDATSVVSAYLAARVARDRGIKTFVLQVMLNTPKYLWGVQDLAKARAMVRLVRDLEAPDFRVILQPRAGLDVFSSDMEKARAQLAAVSAMMDDIEPDRTDSPALVHVVSYSEAVHLADPPVIDESIKITRHALSEHRDRRLRGDIFDPDSATDVAERTERLYSDAKSVIAAIEQSVDDPYSADGFYTVLAAGFLPVPYLWECREEFAHAVALRTGMVDGGVHVIDENGNRVPVEKRCAWAKENVSDIGQSLKRMSPSQRAGR